MWATQQSTQCMHSLARPPAPGEAPSAAPQTTLPQPAVPAILQGGAVVHLPERPEDRLKAGQAMATRDWPYGLFMLNVVGDGRCAHDRLAKLCLHWHAQG